METSTVPRIAASPSTTTPHGFSWRLFFVLSALLVVASVAITPYNQTIVAGMHTLPPSSGLSIQTTPLLGIVINSLVLAPVLALGLFLAGRIGLGAPILDGWARGRPVGQRARAIVKPAIASGLGVGALLVLVAEYGFGSPLQAEIARLKITLVAGGHPPAWQGFLAAFYGGLFEELMLRLFLLSALAWLGSQLFHTADGRPTVAVLAVATVLASIPFALGRLPVAAAIGLSLDTLVVTRTLVLNMAGGIVFGWLYRTRGLETAMLAHFCADTVVAGIAPLVFATWIR